jgi:hypothetical protein|nr:hypothetical protein [Candidatus Krumholzibacteria bacterium]
MSATTTSPAPLPLSRLGRFWLPLQATWLMMAVEGPFLAAIIARLPDPKFNLAAYGVAFSLAIMVEAPVIMMMSASTALVDSAGNYRRLRNFTWMLNLGITLVMLLLIFTPAWDLVIFKLIKLDPEVARLTHTSLTILLPWPAAIGYRRFYQGLLIRTGLTRRVAWGTVVRLGAMGLSSALVWRLTDLPGAWVGAWALTAGVVAEAVASRLMSRPSVRELLAEPGEGLLGYREIFTFYYPLALTSTISLVVHPMVTFFLGQSRHALESLAVMPVINSLVFVFRTPGLSFQEAAITMMGRSWSYLPQVRRFAAVLGGSAALGLAVLAWTPLSSLWLQGVSGLTPELTRFALPPIRILTLMPALSVLLSLQRSMQVARRQTGPVTWASALEVAGILSVLVLTLIWQDWIGATAAATAFMIGRMAGNAYLVPGLLDSTPPRPRRRRTDLQSES